MKILSFFFFVILRENTTWHFKTIHMKCMSSLIFSEKKKKIKQKRMLSATTLPSILRVNPCPADPEQALPLQKVKN